MKRLIIILVAFVALACEREITPQSQDETIMFSVSAPGLEVTRSEVTESEVTDAGLAEGVDSGTMGLRLHETLLSDYIYGLRLAPEKINDTFTGRWFPDAAHGGQRPKWTDKATNGNIPAMSFFAFAFSPFSKYGSSIVVGEGSRGRSVTITQPSSYQDAGFIDYLLSYEVDVPAQKVGDSYPLIALQLEHALTKVELYVDCAEAFKNSKYKIEFTELCFNDIYTTATLTVSHHKKAGEAGSNLWTVSYASGDGTVNDYNLVADPEDPVVLNVDNEEPVMEFIAFPVSSTFPYTLDVAYRISDTEQTPQGAVIASSATTFTLRNFTPKGWLSGHKVRYSLHIDNGIELTGKITDWVEGDYIEGVIFPDQNVQ